MSKLNAKFVVATVETKFQFADAQQAARFAKALQNYSNRMYCRLGGSDQTAVGSMVNAYPIKSDGSVSEDGFTLGEFAGQVSEKRAKKNTEKKTPKQGRADSADQPAQKPTPGK